MKYFKKIIFLCIFTISLSIFINERVYANEIDNEPLNVGIPCGGSIMDFCDDDGSGGTGGGTNPYSSSTEIPLTKQVNTYTEELKDSSHIYKFTTNFSGSYIIQVGLWGYYGTINISIEKKGDVSHPISSEKIIGSPYGVRDNQVEFSYGFPSPLLSGNTTYYINIVSEKETESIDAVLDITIINYDQDDLDFLFGYTQLNPNTPVSGSIDYEGDVDYYAFTNLGGVYDIYTTGNTNLTMGLYDEDNNLLVYDDNYDGEIIFGTDIRGTLNPGFGCDLGYEDNNFGKTFTLKVEYTDNHGTGNYNIHLEKYIDESEFEASELKNDGIVAVLWESNFIPDENIVYTFLNPKSNRPNATKSYSESYEFLARKLFLIDMAGFNVPDGITTNEEMSYYYEQFEEIKDRYINVIQQVINELEKETTINSSVIRVTQTLSNLTLGFSSGKSVIINIAKFLGAETLSYSVYPSIEKIVNMDLDSAIISLINLQDEIRANGLDVNGHSLNSMSLQEKIGLTYHDGPGLVSSYTYVRTFDPKLDVTIFNDTIIKPGYIGEFGGQLTFYTKDDLPIILDLMEDIADRDYCSNILCY